MLDIAQICEYYTFPDAEALVSWDTTSLDPISIRAEANADTFSWTFEPLVSPADAAFDAVNVCGETRFFGGSGIFLHPFIIVDDEAGTVNFETGPGTGHFDNYFETTVINGDLEYGFVYQVYSEEDGDWVDY